MQDFNRIIDVLNDIRAFAQENGLPEVGEKASLAIPLAAEEIRRRPTAEHSANNTQAG